MDDKMTNNLCEKIQKIKVTEDRKKYYKDYYAKNREYILSRRQQRLNNGDLENIEIKPHRINNKQKKEGDNKTEKDLNRENSSRYYNENRNLILAKRNWIKKYGTQPTKEDLLNSDFYKEHKKNNKWINERKKYNDDTVDKNERIKFLQKNRKQKINDIINIDAEHKIN